MVADVEWEDESAATAEKARSKSGNTHNLTNTKKKSLPSLADSWRWLKGLLYDFVSLKKDHAKSI